MSNNSASINIGGGFGSMLLVAFIVLKLCHVINWSWWWVLCPLWIGPLILFGLLILLIVGYLLAFIGLKRQWKGY